MLKTNGKTRSVYFPERITKAMKEIFDYPLTIVEAPMGYGKTTAVREHLSDTNANILWQRVYDSSTTSFWKGFCHLFSQLDYSRSQSLSQLGFPNDSVMIQEALNIIEAIELPEDTVLVIDDYHLIGNAEINFFIELLVKNEILNLYIVLTARYTGFQNHEELMLKGYMQHITKEIFELMPMEIVKYYKLCGINIKAMDADKLYTHTEGWISALYLIMLNFLEEGKFSNITNIDKLIDKAVFMPFSIEIKDFLVIMSIFDSFTIEQASYMWEKENTEVLLTEIINKNAFIKYDTRSGTYQIHNLFINFLKDRFEAKESHYKQGIHTRAAKWYMRSEEFLTSMMYAYLAQDFNYLLEAFVMDKGKSFNSEHKDLIIKYFEECNEESKQRFPFAMLAYALRLFTFSEIELFKKACGEFISINMKVDMPEELRNMLMGEFELILSFTAYNDIEKMSEYHKRVCSLLRQPSFILDQHRSWTFGSPSVLYMFYRKTGELSKEVEIIKEAMPFYYQITDGHGKGAELVMAAEHYYYMGDFENSEIEVFKVNQEAGIGYHSGIMLCTIFLEIRLAFSKGEFHKVLQLFKKLHEDINDKKLFLFMHTLDMCEAYIYSNLNMKEHIPLWIKNGEFKNTRLFFPSRAFLNIVYGRVLLINGEYLKLIGSMDYFMGISSVFPNLLGQIHTYIYLAAANKQIYRQKEGLEALKLALDIAMPDKVYMPFVENCDFIQPLLEELQRQGSYCVDIARILELYKPYQKTMEQIKNEHFTENKPKLTGRELEIAQLAAQGLSNKEISERQFISQNTVKTQLKSVFEKLGVNSRSLLQQHFDDIS